MFSHFLQLRRFCIHLNIEHLLSLSPIGAIFSLKWLLSCGKGEVDVVEQEERGQS